MIPILPQSLLITVSPPWLSYLSQSMLFFVPRTLYLLSFVLTLEDTSPSVLKTHLKFCPSGKLSSIHLFVYSLLPLYLFQMCYAFPECSSYCIYEARYLLQIQ